MSSAPLIDIIPIMRREQDGAIITQFDYPTCESLGLMKMDFLGLRNLTVLDCGGQHRTQPRVHASAGGPAAGRRARTRCSGGARHRRLSTRRRADAQPAPLMRPDNFEDISAVLALYRPGPMGADSHTNYALRKNRRQEITPIYLSWRSLWPRSWTPLMV